VPKTHLALASLTAAVPAGLLAFLIVSTFLSDSFDQMGGLLTVLAGLTLVCGSVVALMPVGILIFGPKSDKPKKDKESKASDNVVAVAPSSGELSAVEMDAADAFSDPDMDASTSAFEMDEIDEDEVVVADDDMFDEVSDEFDDFDFEEEEEEPRGKS